MLNNAYDYSFRTLKEETPLPLAAYQGKVLLVVNTASQCGFTPQYAALEDLYQRYKDQGLLVLGVPSNDFGGQEPGTNGEIAQFCHINYGVTFPMAAKEQVVGKEAHPFYLWAKKELGFWSVPRWNFHKYLVDRNGRLVDYFFTTTAPTASRFLHAVNKALNDNI